VPGLEVDYNKFLQRVHEETENPEWNIENHPARQILARFSPEFGNWVSHLEHLQLLKKGGYPFEKNDLDLIDWKALALLESLKKGKDKT
jgi:hypothetical protein